MKNKKEKISIAIVLIIILQLIVPALKVNAALGSKEEILNSMTTKEKVTQMLMPAFRTYNEVDVTSLNTNLENVIANYGFAGVILFDHNNTSTEQTLRLIDSMQKANIKNEERPQLLVSVDQEGAGVTRLAEGTQGPGNMALGATGDSENAYSLGKIIGEELKAIGYNVDFAPVVDVNNNPSNPVIGVRSFSDDANIVSEFGSQFMQGLKDQNIITSLKHFPGHGDTSSDSHTGLPRIEKTYDELKKNELIPFIKCIEDGTEMIMTAHIQYPKIENEKYTSIKDGKQIELPATLSKKIITDILRTDLGYNGVVITDAMEMDAIFEHFDKLDSTKLAINAGVDIILMPVQITNDNEIQELDQYITDVANLVDNGEISIENVNKSVLRILTLKENNGLLNTYSSENLQAKIDNAKNIVGSKENHDKEWEISKKSITLVKNDNNMLPIRNNEETIILVPYDNEVLAGEYAIKKLKEDNIISNDMDISVYLIEDKEIDEIKEQIKDAKNVILITEQYSEAGLARPSYQKADKIIEFVHEQGNKIACISCYLPYDVARVQNADSLLLAYSARGMYELPNFENGAVKTFGVSIPCSIYTAFDKDATLGKLPVNIPKLDSDYKYTSEYLYERNYGLQYKAEEITYEFIEGANQIYTLGEGEATFEINADYSLFENGGKVYVDDTLTSSDNYTSKAGSTIITFTQEYMNSLDEGEHTLKVAFNNNGTATTKFTVAKEKESEDDKTSNPKTGDNVEIWMSLMVVSAIGIIATVIVVKKNK